jgi:hypothetical protein
MVVIARLGIVHASRGRYGGGGILQGPTANAIDQHRRAMAEQLVAEELAVLTVLERHVLHRLQGRG